ncbi:MAG: Spo0B domain-containing protein [Oscillospiraceae bacterium]|nr:Spo0B domain-containing protein [Oscillospiraceae bacterium]
MEQISLRKTFILVAIFNAILAMLIASLTIYTLAYGRGRTLGPELYLLPTLSLVALCGAVLTIALLRPVVSQSHRLRQAEQSLDDLNKLNNTMRAQRHDFMNHLQVVHSLIELGEHLEANAYIDKVYDAIEKVSNSLKTGIPAVNAILEAKRQAAENRGIDVLIEISTTLAEVPVIDWELCKVLGNIMDNSINALSEHERQEHRFLHVEIFEDIHSYKFKISNNGPVIPQELWDKIFETGFTTRVRDGEGMGLAICRNIISKYKGKLWVISDEVETVFEGFVPR